MFFHNMKPKEDSDSLLKIYTYCFFSILKIKSKKEIHILVRLFQGDKESTFLLESAFCLFTCPFALKKRRTGNGLIGETLDSTVACYVQAAVIKDGS